MKRLLQHGVIALYIATTLSGFAYTMFRYQVPGMPVMLWHFSYGMMAPYQNYRTFNEELVAEGARGNGPWEPIDLMPYLPFVRGERAMRSYLVSFRYKNDDWERKYDEYAKQLRAAEARSGREWDAIKLSLERWPMSPGGYEFLRLEPFIERTVLTQ